MISKELFKKPNNRLEGEQEQPALHRATPEKAGATKGGKSWVSGAASDKSKGAVPTSMPASAARKNPLKAEPVNKKIHASARSRTRANEAKRDSR